jgi:alkylation response protein AidB-like acyl-CoA dehydrogenase
MFQPFTEEHEQFRKTARSFAEKELAPHAEEWEEAELFPNEVFKRAGELGILGAHFPEEHGGGGLDYWFSVVKAEELPRSALRRRGHGPARAERHGHTRHQRHRHEGADRRVPSPRARRATRSPPSA